MTIEKVSIILPSNPNDVADIFSVIKNISDSKTRQEGEKSFQATAIADLAEKYDIEPKHLRQLANDYHKDQFEKKEQTFSEYSALYERIVEDGAKYLAQRKSGGASSLNANAASEEEE